MRDESWSDDEGAGRRSGLVFGVCRWLADLLGLSAVWVRLAVVVAAWLSGWWPAAAIYLAAAILLGQARPPRLQAVSDWRLPRGFTSRDVADLRHRCGRLEQRSREAEARLRRDRTWDDILRRPA